jgi:hypothetical protein
LKHQIWNCLCKAKILSNITKHGKVYAQQSKTPIPPSSQSQFNSSVTVFRSSGILVPGGFGTRGTEGKILAAHWARTHKIPYLGICLGLQTAVIEFARNVCGLDGAHSAELDEATPHPVVVSYFILVFFVGERLTCKLDIHAGDFKDAFGWDNETW